MVDSLSADIVTINQAISTIIGNDVYLTEEEYDALVAADDVDPTKRYFTYED